MHVYLFLIWTFDLCAQHSHRSKFGLYHLHWVPLLNAFIPNIRMFGIFFLYTLFPMFHSLDFCFACRTSTSRFTSVFCVLSVIHAASVYSSILNLNLDTDVQYLQILIEIKTIKSIRNIHAHISFVCSYNECASVYFLVLDFSRWMQIKYLHFERYHLAWL